MVNIPVLNLSGDCGNMRVCNHISLGAHDNHSSPQSFSAGTAVQGGQARRQRVVPELLPGSLSRAPSGLSLEPAAEPPPLQHAGHATSQRRATPTHTGGPD